MVGQFAKIHFLDEKYTNSTIRQKRKVGLKPNLPEISMCLSLVEEVAPSVGVFFKTILDTTDTVVHLTADLTAL